MWLLQECIKPIKIDKKSGGTGAKIKIEEDGSYLQVKEVSFYGDANITSLHNKLAM